MTATPAIPRPLETIVRQALDGALFDQLVAQGWIPPGCGVSIAVQLPAARARRVYVAGPMTGLPEYNFPAFHAAADLLRADGWQVFNPADHGVVDGAAWADYLHADLPLLCSCEAVYLLPGWTNSRGALLEAHVAVTLGMRLMRAPGAETAPMEPREMPAMTDSLREVLGLPVHQYLGIVRALQQLGPTIKHRFEDEQASLLHWALGFWFKHRDGWRAAAGAELQRLADEAKAAKASASSSAEA